MKFFIALALLWLALCGTAAATALSDAAAALQPGQWTSLTISPSTTVDDGAGNTTTEFSNKFVYDSVNKQLWFYGGAHGATVCCLYSTLIKYTESTAIWAIEKLETSYNGSGSNSTTLFCISNPAGCTWSVDGSGAALPPNPPQGPARLVGHSYQHNAFDSSRRRIYLAEYGSQWLVYYNPATATFTRVADLPYSNGASIALEYYPDIDRIVITSNGHYITLYNPGSDCYESVLNTCNNGTISVPYTEPDNNSIYDTVAVYSAKDHVVYFGGGHDSGAGGVCGASPCFHKNMFKINTSAVVSAIANAPTPVNVQNASYFGGTIVVDPTSGHILYFGFDQSTAYPYTAKVFDYNPASDAWTTVSSSLNPPWYVGGSACTSGCAMSSGAMQVVTVAIPAYGVIAQINVENSSHGGPKLYLFRYASDFQVRCSASGVIRCFGFDTTADLGGVFGSNFGYFNNNLGAGTHTGCNGTSNTQCPTIDNSTYASGGGSLKFVIASQSGAGGSGQWFTNFSSDLLTQIGANQDVYVQWRQRFTPGFLTNQYQTLQGWKQFSIGTGDQASPSVTYASCNDLDIPVQNQFLRGFAEVYHSCTGLSTFPNVTVTSSATTGTVTLTTSVPFFTSDMLSSNAFTYNWTIAEHGSTPVGTLTPGATTGSGVTFTCSACTFNSGHIGWSLYEYGSGGFGTGGIATITSITNSTHAVGTITQAFSSTSPIPSASWLLQHATQGYAVLTGITDSTHATATVSSAFANTNGMTSGNWSASEYSAYNPFNEFVPPNDIKFQNGRPSPFCLYSQGPEHGGAGYFPPNGNCFPYNANEWMTFKMHIHLGARAVDASGNDLGFWKNSQVDFYGARENQSSVPLVSWGPFHMTAGVLSANEKFGKVWLLPYQTAKDATQVTSQESTWYDELIISTQNIADPGGGGGPILNPVVVHIGSGKTVRVGNGQVLRSGLN